MLRRLELKFRLIAPVGLSQLGQAISQLVADLHYQPEIAFKAALRNMS